MAEEERRILYPLDAGSYRILDEIGSGVSAVVYKATCVPLDSAVVAVKSIDLERSRASLDDVRREAKAMALLSHPNILTAHCSFIVDRRLWVVMPFMAAGSLHSIISSSFPSGLPETSIAVVLREVLHALSYLHGQGHIHRDIKAGNILVDSDGSVKLADFGVSASMYESSSSSSSSSSSIFREMAGTPYWMAPEVIHSHVGYGVKADIWSFGITALELAHGRPPLSHLPLSKSLMMRITNRLQLDDAHDKSGSGGGREKKKKKFSKAFKNMVASCLAHDPAKRPSAERLLRHPFFKNCKSSDHLVKNVLHALPSVVERFKESSPAGYPNRIGGAGGGSSSPDAKIRRISGWNFNEGFLKMDPVYPSDNEVMQAVRRRVSFGGEELIGRGINKDHYEGEEEWDSPEASPALKETLVPNLVSLLSSLEVQRGMVMNVLTYCGGGEDRVENGREQQLLGFVMTLQQTVDDLNRQLEKEKKRNEHLEEVLDSLGLKDTEEHHMDN